MLAHLLRLLFALALAGAGAIALALVAWRGWPTGWALLAGLALVEGIHVGVLGVEFGFVARAARKARRAGIHAPGAVREAAETHGAAPARLTRVPSPPGWERVPTLRAWLGEIAASLRAFFYAQLWFGDRDLPSAAVPERIAVLLVHGYVCNRALWQPLAARLAARGHPIASVNLEPVFGSIDEYVPIIAAAIERARQRTGDTRVAIVAHSMGGLAARAYRRTHGDATMAGLITIGTPHQGTHSAFRGVGRNAHEMRPGSVWLRELAAAERHNDNTRVTVIRSEHDNIVVPAQPQTLAGAQTLAFAGLGHVELVYARAAQAAVIDALDALDALEHQSRARGIAAETPPTRLF